MYLLGPTHRSFTYILLSLSDVETHPKNGKKRLCWKHKQSLPEAENVLNQRTGWSQLIQNVPEIAESDRWTFGHSFPLLVLQHIETLLLWTIPQEDPPPPLYFGSSKITAPQGWSVGLHFLTGPSSHVLLTQAARLQFVTTFQCSLQWAPWTREATSSRWNTWRITTRVQWLESFHMHKSMVWLWCFKRQGSQ